MSRIGKLPIKIPEEVKVSFENQSLKVKGPKGEMNLKIDPRIELKIENGQIICSAKENQKSLWGLTRSLIANAIIGVTQEWIKVLELVGVGFKASVEGDTLVLAIGFSHPVRFKAPLGITFNVIENKIQVKGVNKQLVGEVAAQIRRIRPPEPYKGKGIRYEGEKIRKKVGKAVKAIGGIGAGGGK